MAVKKTSGVPASRINLTQPIGARGLPLTFVLSDDKTDTFTGDTTGFAVYDKDLWLSTASGSGTLVNPAPKTPRAAVVSSIPSPFVVQPAEAARTYSGRFQGITLNTAAGVLNAEMGSLEFGQAVQDLSDGEYQAVLLNSVKDMTNSYPFATWTQTDVGRYVQHPTREYSSARPGNHTWQQDRDGVGRFVFAGDYSCGATRDSVVLSLGSDGRWAGGKVSATVHYSKVDLPSNGLGSSFGDDHNSAYLTVLGASEIDPLGSVNGIQQADSASMEGHWALNLGVRQRVLASGASLSSPDGCPHQAYSTAKDLLGSATIQHLYVQDSFNGGGTPDPANRGISYIGRTQYGNHVVTDSCGLVGYEGVFTATAFFSIAKDADPNGASTGQVSETDKLTFAGLNIQVHSGRALRRNGEYSIVDTQLQRPYYRYGSDGSYTQPMMAALKTRSDRQDSVFITTEEANLTTFSVLRNETATIGNSQPAATNNGDWNVNELRGITNGNADAILGESATGGQDWNKTTTISSSFLSEKNTHTCPHSSEHRWI